MFSVVFDSEFAFGNAMQMKFGYSSICYDLFSNIPHRRTKCHVGVLIISSSSLLLDHRQSSPPKTKVFCKAPLAFGICRLGCSKLPRTRDLIIGRAIGIKTKRRPTSLREVEARAARAKLLALSARNQRRQAKVDMKAARKSFKRARKLPSEHREKHGKLPGSWISLGTQPNRRFPGTAKVALGRLGRGLQTSYAWGQGEDHSQCKRSSERASETSELSQRFYRSSCPCAKDRQELNGQIWTIPLPSLSEIDLERR
jgi:hypothetical protein